MKALLIVLALCGVAAAQSTGGHMGGGDWSGGGGGGGSSPSWSSSSGWSSSHSSSSNHSSWSSHDDDKPRDWNAPVWDHTPGDGSIRDSNWNPDTHWMLYAGIALTLLIIGGIFVSSWRSSHDHYVTGMEAAEIAGYQPQRDSFPGGVDVTVLRVALDGRARKFIQTELAQIAETCDTATTAGRAAMLVQVTLLLRRVRDAWVYGGAHNLPMGPLQSAKALYDREVDDARTRFEQETISNVQGAKSRQAAGDLTRRADEGEGLILVTIILAARTELYSVNRIGDGEDLRKALEAASYLTGDQLVAVDLVWMPSEAGDRMSSIELEALFPPPEVIRIQGALVGKTFCTYCAGPFPAELVSCPHCGAPVAGRAA